MNGSVIHIFFARQIRRYHLSHGRSAIRKPPCFNRETLTSQGGCQLQALRTFATSIQSFQHNQSTSLAITTMISYFHRHSVCKSSGYSFSTKRGFQNNTISKKPSCYAAMFQKKIMSPLYYMIYTA